MRLEKPLLYGYLGLFRRHDNIKDPEFPHSGGPIVWPFSHCIALSRLFFALGKIPQEPKGGPEPYSLMSHASVVAKKEPSMLPSLGFAPSNVDHSVCSCTNFCKAHQLFFEGPTRFPPHLLALFAYPAELGFFRTQSILVPCFLFILRVIAFPLLRTLSRHFAPFHRADILDCL